MDHDIELFRVAEAFREAVSRLLVPIQTTRVVDESAFQDVHAQALCLVHIMKGRAEVPKAVLGDLLATYGILRAESEYFGPKKEMLECMADKLESCFRMILGDEVPEDRQPGVPRII